MDKFKALDNKIKIVSIVFIVAMVIFLIPSGGQKKVEQTAGIDITTLKKETEKQLSQKLSEIEGVHKASVTITYENDGILHYATDDKFTTKNSNDEGKKNTLETQAERKNVFDGGKNIIIKSREMPVVRGVCVFYSGEETDRTIRSLYNAVKGSLGIEFYKIEVVLTKGK